LGRPKRCLHKAWLKGVTGGQVGAIDSTRKRRKFRRGGDGRSSGGRGRSGHLANGGRHQKNVNRNKKNE